LTSQQDELRSLQAELDSRREIVSEQAEKLDARGQQIEHMKLMIEKLRQKMLGKKSEKVILELEQLEFALDEEETMQAVMEAALGRASPARNAKPKPERKPLPEHLKREVITDVPGHDCCPDFQTAAFVVASDNFEVFHVLGRPNRPHYRRFQSMPPRDCFPRTTLSYWRITGTCRK
jgi:TolA-binding protein